MYGICILCVESWHTFSKTPTSTTAYGGCPFRLAARGCSVLWHDIWYQCRYGLFLVYQLMTTGCTFMFTICFVPPEWDYIDCMFYTAILLKNTLSNTLQQFKGTFSLVHAESSCLLWNITISTRFKLIHQAMQQHSGWPRWKVAGNPLESGDASTNLWYQRFKEEKTDFFGGFKCFFNLHPYPYLGKWSSLTMIFSNGLKPPPRFVWWFKWIRLILEGQTCFGYLPSSWQLLSCAC